MGESRRLTEGEVALARKVFGEGLDYGRVRIRAGAGWNPFAAIAFLQRRVAGITLLSTIHFRGRPVGDYARGGDTGLFLHEMTHVWQAQRLGAPRFFARYLWQLLRAGLRQRRMYLYVPGRTAFAGAGLEAQAQMVQDYHCFRDGPGGEGLRRNLAGSGLHGL